MVTAQVEYASLFDRCRNFQIPGLEALPVPGVRLTSRVETGVLIGALGTGRTAFFVLKLLKTLSFVYLDGRTGFLTGVGGSGTWEEIYQAMRLAYKEVFRQRLEFGEVVLS